MFLFKVNRLLITEEGMREHSLLFFPYVPAITISDRP
jgi:hypothetical protein